jgi:hypothetical protein
MKARAPRQRLDTYVFRKVFLAIHINHKIWEPTPFISVTTSPTAIEAMADMRKRRRGAQTLTVVDPNARLQNHLPIIDIQTEMDYYGVKNPYGERGTFCKDHYLCLWEITEREIIGQWNWDDLVKNPRWYEEVILPAFRKHTVSQAPKEEDFELSSALNQLSCMLL